MKKKNILLATLAIILLIAVILISQRLDLEGIGKKYGYIGIFTVSLMSCMTIVFPIPYIPIIITISATTALNPFWIGIFGGLGAAIGEFTGYAIGKGSSEAISNRWGGQISTLRGFFEKYGFWSIVLVTATPLPTGVMYLVAGMASYSAIRLLVAGIIGKTIFVSAVAYFGENIYSLSNLSLPAILIVGGIIAIAAVIYLSKRQKIHKKVIK